jgi:uncharacterized membrane protein (DUF4010 family)
MNDEVIGLCVATLGGAAIGIERQWSGHASGPDARFGGVRTFSLLGGLSGFAGIAAMRGFAVFSAILAASAAALVLLSYAHASRRDLDATTEIAGLVVIAAGFVASIGHIALASAAIAVAVLLLVEKSSLHAWARGLDDAEMRAAARFAVMAVVILPLLPPGPYGPFGGVHPRELWMLVLLVSGLSFAAYVTRRVVGERRGYVVAGLLGGMISSTSVTLSFARVSRDRSSDDRALALGVVGACSVMFARLLLLVLLLDPALAGAAAKYLVAPCALGALLTLGGLWFSPSSQGRPPAAPGNPLQFGAAIQLAVLLQAVLFAVHVLRERWADAGILVSGAVGGLVDTDAVALSMIRSSGAGSSSGVLAAGIAVGALSNTVFKLALGAALGGPRFRRALLLSLSPIALVAGAALLLLPFDR